MSGHPFGPGDVVAHPQNGAEHRRVVEVDVLHGEQVMKVAPLAYPERVSLWISLGGWTLHPVNTHP